MTPEDAAPFLVRFMRYQRRHRRPHATTDRLCDDLNAIAPRLDERSLRAGVALCRAIGHLPTWRLPPRSRLAKVIFALAADRSRGLWHETLGAIAAASASRAAPCFSKAVLAHASARVFARGDYEAAELMPLVPQLEATARSLLGRRRSIHIEPTPELDREDELTARTDGYNIALPTRIRLCRERALNRLAFVRLMAHEVAHLEAGSFRMHQFDSASRLDTLLAPRRDLHALRIKMRPWDHLGLERPDSVEMLPAQVHAALHMRDPHVFLPLLNRVEDIRVERWLAARQPRLGRLSTYFDAVEWELRPHPVYLDAEDNFLTALEAVFQGSPIVNPIAASHRPAFDALHAEIRLLHSRDLADVIDAIEVAARLHDVIIDHLPVFTDHPDPDRFDVVSLPPAAGGAPGDLKARDERLYRRLRQRLTEGADPLFDIAMPPELLLTRESEDDPFVENDNLVMHEETDLSEGRRAFVYDEVDRRDVKGHQAAHVYEEDVLAAEPTARPPEPAPLAVSTALEPDLDGDELDFDRAYDLVVALRSHGRPVDERVYRRRRRPRRSRPSPNRPDGHEAAPTNKVTFLVDLTPSMFGGRHAARLEDGFVEESDQPGEGAIVPQDPTPITHVRQLLTRLVPVLDSAGVPTEIWGGADMGRKDCRLWPIKRAHEPAAMPWLARITRKDCLGFRHGAYVRHLTRCDGNTPPRQLVLLTDCGSHYVSYGVERFWRNAYSHRCEDCTPELATNPHARSGLWRRMCDPSEPTGEVAGYGLTTFLETHVELADLRLAVASSPSAIHAVLIGSHYQDANLDRALGIDRWTRITGEADLELAHQRLQRFLADDLDPAARTS